MEEASSKKKESNLNTEEAEELTDFFEDFEDDLAIQDAWNKCSFLSVTHNTWLSNYPTG